MIYRSANPGTNPSGTVAAWIQTVRSISRWSRLALPKSHNRRARAGTAKARKRPAIAFNAQGEMILVWTEGTAWQKGGDLVWQVFDKSGKPTSEKGRVERGIPVWGLPTVVTKEAGFTVMH